MTLEGREPTLNERDEVGYRARSATKPGRFEKLASLRSIVGTVRAFVTFDRVVSVVLIAAGLYAFVYSAAVVGEVVWYEGHLPYNVDTSLYWTVGRGILEGFVPYRDLFETKPPGIFLFSALSLWLTGDFWLTNVGHIAALLTVSLSPFVFLVGLIREPRQLLSRLSVWLALASLVLVITAFVGVYSCEVQVETYGVAGTVLYMLLVGRPGKWAFAGRALGIALAIGLKEPFLLVIPAIYLVLRAEPRRDLADFWGPLLTTALAGTLFMAVMGWLVPFVKIYLRTMVGGHVKLAGSPLERALAFELTWGSLKNYSAFLPYVMLYVVFVYVTCGGQATEGSGPKSSVHRIQILFVGFLLSWLAVGMGGTYYSHHYVLAVPLYLAVIYALLRDLPNTSTRLWFRPGIVGLVLLLPTWVPLAEYESRFTDIERADLRARRAAVVIDDFLDRVHVDRYLWLGPGGHIPVPFTRHVPLGPLFFQQVAFFEGKYSKLLVEEFEKRLAEARVVVLFHHMTGPLDDHVREVLARDYEPVPKKLLPPKFEYKVFVRKGVDLTPLSGARLK